MMDVLSAVPPQLPQTSYSEINPGDADETTLDFTNYLRNLAGHVDVEVNTVLRDHCYCKPWNWKPESVYVKPTKRIFFPNSNLSKPTTDNEIDVLTPDPSPKDTLSEHFPELSTTSPHNTEELQKLLNLARPEDSENWEENINKTFWSAIQTRLWEKATKILTTEHLSRLVKTSSPTEAITRKISMDATSRRFRQLFGSTGYDWKLIQWLHSLLFDSLPKDFLMIYLDVLHNLRSKIPQVVDRILSTQPRILTKSNASISWDSIVPLLKRSYDPVPACLNSSRPRKLPGNPILIITPSGTSSQISTRQLKWISSLGHLSTVVHVNSHFGLGTNKINMTACADQLVQVTRTKIQEMRSDCPGRPLILVGFNSGAALACQIAHIEHVTAVVAVGFPFCTVEGSRGTPDDVLMDIRCPVMFVVGENAMTVRIDDLEDMRERMLVETSLVIVGGADDQLRMATNKRFSEGISQSMVDRCVVDEIGNFIGGILLRPNPLPLRHPGVVAYDRGGQKKEPRKRKGSGSSVAEAGKKSRPVTPTVVSPLVTQGSGNLQVVLHVPQKGAVKQVTTPALKRTFDPKTTNITASEASHHHHHHHFSGQTPPDGGITLNIGSLASLGPIGPIRLAPSQPETSKPLKVSKTTQARINSAQNHKNSPRITHSAATDLLQRSADLESRKMPSNSQVTPEQSNENNQLGSAQDKAPSIADDKKKRKSQIKDFDSILDIPIIFAKDDGTLSGLEKPEESTPTALDVPKPPLPTKTEEPRQQKQQYHIISSKGVQNLSFLNVNGLPSENAAFKHTRIIFTKDSSIINSKLPATINLIHKKKVNNKTIQ